MRGPAVAATVIPLMLIGAIAAHSQSTTAPIAGSTELAPAVSRPQAPGPELLSASETHGELKQVAIEAALALTSYDPAETPRDIAARLGFDGDDEALASAQALYHAQSSSRSSIVYAQLAGILSDRAAVMVVTEQEIGTARGMRIETRTLDVRLRFEAGQWWFDHLASAGGEPVSMPEHLPPEVVAVLDNPRIELPDSARWDILAGRVSPDLLRLLARTAEQVPIGITVTATGHPWEIFGTDRQSDHSRGLAADIYRINTTRVIDDRAVDSTTHRLVNWLYAQPELARMGSPWALDGFGGRSFTDALHQDHLHLAVYQPGTEH